MLVSPPLALNPADFSLLSPVVAAAGLAGQHGHLWRLRRRQRGARLRQARLLYVEVVGNLVWGRVALGVHPPMLLVSRPEWMRPGTAALLADVLDDPRHVTVVAAAYTMLDVYESLFRRSWFELLTLRLSGGDVAAIAQVVERFAEAEQVLRPALYDKEGQELIEKALSEVLTKTSAPPDHVPLTARLNNLRGSIPVRDHLVALGALAGLWLVDLLRSHGRHRGWRSRLLRIG